MLIKHQLFYYHQSKRDGCFQNFVLTTMILIFFTERLRHKLMLLSVRTINHKLHSKCSLDTSKRKKISLAHDTDEVLKI